MQNTLNTQHNHAKFFTPTPAAGDSSGVDYPQPQVQDSGTGVHAVGIRQDASGYAKESVAEELEATFQYQPSHLVAGPTIDRSIDAIHKTDFSEYIVPIESTDYEGLEKIDPRLVDRTWRLNNLYWVVDEEGKLLQFKMRPAQAYLMKNMHHRNIILKARQLGFTTFICIFMLDYSLFNRNKQLGIIAHTKDDASVIFRKVKVAWENFPKDIKEFLKLGTIGDSATEYQFTNGSIMRVSTSLRSGTYQMVLVTEFGKICARFPEKATEIVTGTLPAIPTTGVLFIESTAEGEDGYFYEYCQEAMEAKQDNRVLTKKDFKFFFFPWYQNPADVIGGPALPMPLDMIEYFDKMEQLVKVKFTQDQRNWYFLTSKELKGKMKQEHPTTPEEAFLTSGNKLFTAEVIDAQREKYAQEPLEIQGDFKIFRHYVRNHVYGLGADVSQGTKRDSSTIVVIDFTTGEIVMTYRSNEVDPVTFAHDIKRAAIMYGGCIAAPEANNVGLTTCVTLHAIYPNIFTQVREGLLETSPTNKLGFLTTSASKPKYMYELAEALENDDLKCLDETILLEAKRFNKEDALVIQVSDTTTRHFDLLTAAGIAYQMKIYGTRGKADPEDVARVEERRERVRNQGRKVYR